MFSLHINNNEIYMPEEFNFGIVLESPLFNQRGNYSYPFTVPYEPNKHYFGHLKELSSNDPELPIPFEIRWNDIPQLAGEVSKFNYVNDQIELTLIGAKSLFHNKFLGKHLDEINMGGQDYSGNTAEEVKAAWALATKVGSVGNSPPNYNYFGFTFAPLYCENFYPSGSTNSRYWTNPVINKWDSVNETFDDDAITCMNLYMMYVIEKLIEHTGYTIRRNDLNLNGDGLFNLLSIDLKRLYFVSWLHIRPSQVANTNFEYRHALPHVKVSDFFSYLGEWLGLYINANDVAGTVDIILIKEALADNRIESRLNRSVLLDNRERETWKPKEIALKYNMSGEEFESNLTTVEPAEVDGTVSVYSSLSTPSSAFAGKIYTVTSTGHNYQCLETTPETDEDSAIYSWVLVGEFGPATYTPDGAIETNETELSIGTHLSDIFDVGVTIPNQAFQQGADIELPYSTQSLGIDYTEIVKGVAQKTDYGISFLIYKGMKDYTTRVGNVEFQHTHANYDKFPIKGNLPDGWLSLKLTGTRSIYTNFKQIPMEWEATQKRPVSFFLEVPPGAVFALDFLLKYQLDDLSFHLNKIHINFTRKRISSVRLECYYASGGNMELPQHYLQIDEDGHHLLIDSVNKLLID